MADEKELRPLARYLEFGTRLFLEDFAQLISGVLLIYVPISLLGLFILPSMENIPRNAEGIIALLPRSVISQLILRVLQTFVMIMLILRIDARRKSGENVWDFSTAYACLWRVVAVDLVFFIGLYILVVPVFVVAMMVAGFLLGRLDIVILVAAMISLAVLMGPFTRYYFASYVSLFHGTRLSESFGLAAIISSGGERLVIALLVPFCFLWFLIWVVSTIVFGGGILGVVIFHAGMIVASIPYYIASYLLYLDLVPPEADDKSAAGGGEIPGVIDPFGPEPPEAAPGGENPEETHPPEK